MEDATPPLTAADWLPQIQFLFKGSKAKFGTPEAPTKAGFVALARAGKDVWNAWRATWPRPIPDFSGVKFGDEDFWSPSDPQQFDFSGFHFAPSIRNSLESDRLAGRLDGVDFAGAQFLRGVDFSGAQFGDTASFERAQFLDDVDFSGAQFGNSASFQGVQFEGGADFSDAQFGDDASFWWAKFEVSPLFERTRFGESVSFTCAQFGGGVHFVGAQFGSGANFFGTQFDDGVDLSRANFGNGADFSGAYFGNHTEFYGAKFGSGASFDALEEVTLYPPPLRIIESLDEVDHLASKPKAEATGQSPGTFPHVSFRGVHFAGHVSFRGRHFKGITSFAPIIGAIDLSGGVIEGTPARKVTRFDGIPYFHGCTLNQDTSFDDAEFNAPPSADAARAYRTLKLAFAQQEAIREEQRFFRLELDAEAGIAKGARRIMFWLYRELADYGFSFRRPLFLWLGSLGTCGLLYGLIAGPFPSFATGIDWSRTAQWAQFAVINAVPLPGFDRALMELRGALFGPEKTVLLVATVIELLHKAVSLLAMFLAGLALRNLFKMKG